jgi:hypothetical protein
VATFIDLFYRWRNDHLLPPHSELVISILNSFNVLCNPPFNESELKEVLVDIAVLEKITEVLNTLREDAKKNPDMGVRLCCSLLKAYGHLMYQSSQSQDSFDQRVGYDRLRKLLTSIVSPTKDILIEVLNIAIEDNFNSPKSDFITLHNISMVSMLIKWIPTVEPALRSWLVSRVFELCTHAIHNRQLCCSHGLLRVVVEVLATSQGSNEHISTEVENQLIQLIEVLGSHSIVTAELKQIIGALRTTEDKKLPSYYYKLQQALCSMAQHKEGITPLYYFDLRQSGSHISMPNLKSMPSGGSTFHAWVCLNAPSSLGRSVNMEVIGEKNRCRRILYSFYTRNGNGFEAFFTENMNFVVSTTTKKEFHAYIVFQALFRSYEWHSICIVHQSTKKIFSKEDIQIYMDGNLIDQVSLKSPALTEHCYCYIGSSYANIKHRATSVMSVNSTNPENSLNAQDFDSDNEQLDSLASMAENGVNTIPVQEVEERWGKSINLGGLLSSICIFSEPLSSGPIKTLFHYGPNKLSLFQPNCVSTSELSSKVLVYYHPKACKDGHCVNLVPHTPDNKLVGLFTGQPYVTWDVKNVLSSLGGVELLFPILEQVSIPLKQIQHPSNVSDPSNQPLSSVFTSE